MSKPMNAHTFAANFAKNANPIRGGLDMLVKLNDYLDDYQRHDPAATKLTLRQLFAEWFRRRTERAELASLDERALADIGISRSEAMVEAGKPFWKA